MSFLLFSIVLNINIQVGVEVDLTCEVVLHREAHRLFHLHEREEDTGKVSTYCKLFGGSMYTKINV